MTANHEDITGALGEVVRNCIPGATSISDLHRLPGGASQETWRFDAETSEGPVPLIMRRGVGGNPKSEAGATHVTLNTEAQLINLAHGAGVPVPNVRHVLKPEDGMGSGFIMDFIEGETIARKILRDDVYAQARPKLARQCGEFAARIHSIPTTDLDALSQAPATTQLAEYKKLYDDYDYPHPVFEIAFRWLEERLPENPPLTLVHGDYRHGNFIIGPDGVRAVLDWELAHLGDPMADLGWICVNSWRYGNIDQPVGGFGTREDLFAGYESVRGAKVEPERVRFWETFGTLKWGIMCMSMYNVFNTGLDRSVERAAIGRRSSETEIDLLRILTQET